MHAGAFRKATDRAAVAACQVRTMNPKAVLALHYQVGAVLVL
jgi:hypothetical protein